MKISLLSFCLMFSTVVFSQNFEAKFEVIYKAKFSAFAINKFKEETEKSKNNSRQEWINKTENPKPSYYITKFNDKFSITEYQASINNDQESNLEVNIKPFGSGEIIKLSQKDSLNTFMRHRNLGDDIFSKKKLLDLNWIDSKKDSIILKYKVHLVEAETTEANYSVWYTKELPSGVGISDIKFNNGFIVYCVIKKKSSQVFDYEIIEAKPVYIRKNKKDVTLNKFSLKKWKIFTESEIKEKYNEFNKRNNSMQ